MRELKPRALQALLLDAAVWLCCDDDVVHKLDTLCFGNLDGGGGTAAHVRQALEAAGQAIGPGDKAVRLSLDEAFFMAYALDMLAVHDLVDGAAVPLDTTVSGGGCAARLAQRSMRSACSLLSMFVAEHCSFLLAMAG